MTARLLSGQPVEAIDAHSIQPYYAALLAGQCGMELSFSAAVEGVALIATRLPSGA